MSNLKYEAIYKHYEKTFDKHGANHKGMDWPKKEDLISRFAVMLELIKQKKEEEFSLLDLGCGVGLFLDYVNVQDLKRNLKYHGIDISSKMISAANKKFPKSSFEVRDILKNPLPENKYDYIIMNGLLTEKVSLTYSDMKKFAEMIVQRAYQSARVGIAFNTMSSHVDWERKDLFHWALDDLMSFLTKKVSRNVVIRMDYGLYEYTTYVYK